MGQCSFLDRRSAGPPAVGQLGPLGGDRVERPEQVAVFGLIADLQHEERRHFVCQLLLRCVRVPALGGVEIAPIRIG
jgi:hypothetical protein